MLQNLREKKKKRKDEGRAKKGRNEVKPREEKERENLSHTILHISLSNCASETAEKRERKRKK